MVLHRPVELALIIGWQGKEAHFLQMLRPSLPLFRQLMVVGRNSPDADGILKHFLKETSKHISPENRDVGRGGFTDFIVNEEGHNFFKA